MAEWNPEQLQRRASDVEAAFIQSEPAFDLVLHVLEPDDSAGVDGPIPPTVAQALSRIIRAELKALEERVVGLVYCEPSRAEEGPS